MADYIRWLRRRVGSDHVQFVFAIACVLREGVGDEPEVLLQERGDTGGWGFPGGAVELDERAADAAVRETLEETGVTVVVDDLLGVYTGYRQDYPNGDSAHTIAIVFTAHPVTGSPRPVPIGAGAETVGLAWAEVPVVPVLFNQQHNDILADLRAGRRGVHR